MHEQDTVGNQIASTLQTVENVEKQIYDEGRDIQAGFDQWNSGVDGINRAVVNIAEHSGLADDVRDKLIGYKAGKQFNIVK